MNDLTHLMNDLTRLITSRLVAGRQFDVDVVVTADKGEAVDAFQVIPTAPVIRALRVKADRFDERRALEINTIESMLNLNRKLELNVQFSKKFNNY